ncbi:MAG: head-tail adaptor protein [Bacteroidales bacterium]|nr:head-tail adaptor protein [Bacteroidales bacterium]
MKYPLNKLITIEKGVSGDNLAGSSITTYSEYITTYANVYVRSGNVRFNESEELIYTTEFTIRYNTLTREIDNEYRIKYNNKYYSIIEIIEIEPRSFIKIIGQHYAKR